MTGQSGASPPFLGASGTVTGSRFLLESAVRGCFSTAVDLLP